jgi:hypothetical protein
MGGRGQGRHRRFDCRSLLPLISERLDQGCTGAIRSRIFAPSIASCQDAHLSPRAVPGCRGAEVLEVAPGSPLFKWLADGNATAALVRLDFTVQALGRDVARLCEAAPKFLVA